MPMNSYPSPAPLGVEVGSLWKPIYAASVPGLGPGAEHYPLPKPLNYSRAGASTRLQPQEDSSP